MSVNPDHWDTGKGKVKPGVKDATSKNYYLQNLIQKIHDCKRDIIERGQQLTAQRIIDVYNGQDDQNRGILEIFDDHNIKCEELSGKDYAPSGESLTKKNEICACRI